MAILATLPIAGDASRENLFFSPKRLSPVAWFDARVETALGVDFWRDRIDGAVVSQSVSGSRPVWSPTAIGGVSPGFVFDGTDDRFTASQVPATLPDGAEAGWFFAVVDQQASGDATPDNRFIASYGDNVPSRSFGRRDVGGLNRSYVQGSDVATGSGATADFTGASVYFAQYSSGTMSVWLNGVAEPGFTATLATTLLRFRIGANSNSGAGSFWQGGIGQVLIGAGSLTTQQRQDLEGWGARLFDAPEVLPTGHPRRDGSLF